MNDFSFNSDNYRLDGTLFYPSSKKDTYPAILFVHGWTSKRARSFQYAGSLADLGYLCMLFDMRGHGTSQGDINKATTKEFLDDVLAAYGYLSEVKGVDPENISVVGSSFGCYLIALLSEKRKIKNLVLRAPADYPNEAFEKIKKVVSGDEPDVVKWRNQPKQPAETFALEAIHNFEGNVLIIESEKDRRIPHQTVLNYMNAIKDKSKLNYVLMKNAPHSIKEGPFRDEVERILVEWFRNKF